MEFVVNDQEWNLQFVKPSSKELMRSNMTFTLGMTDNNTRTVYINNRLSDYMTNKVLAHELVHCFCFSRNIYMPIEEEERLADWVSLHGVDLVYLLDDLMSVVIRRVAK